MDYINSEKMLDMQVKVLSAASQPAQAGTSLSFLAYILRNLLCSRVNTKISNENLI